MGWGPVSRNGLANFGFVYSTLQIQRTRKLQARIQRRREKITILQQAERDGAQIGEDEVSAYGMRTLKALRKGGVTASDAVRDVRERIDELDPVFFNTLTKVLIREQRYPEAKSLHVVRMSNPDLYAFRSSKVLLDLSARKMDVLFAKKVARDIIDHEQFKTSTISARDHLDVTAAMALTYQRRPTLSFLKSLEKRMLRERKPVDKAFSKMREESKGLETIGVEFEHSDDFSEEDEEVTTYMNPFGRTDLVQEDEEFVDAKVKYSVESYDDTVEEKKETNALVALEQGPLRFGEMISSAMLNEDEVRSVKLQRREEVVEMCKEAREYMKWSDSKKRTSRTEEKQGVDFLRPYNNLMAALSKTGMTEAVFKTLDLMKLADIPPNTFTYEAVGNAVIKSVRFLKSAVDMQTLPPRLIEAAFVGRSNVGKSSLINMLCGKKRLALTSNTPGKTKMFNYFIANDQKEAHGRRFYLVDLPGVGFARVDSKTKDHWTQFTTDYFWERQSLKIVFHLIDSKIGIQKHDLELMDLVKETDIEEKYCVVLTKVDKLGNKRVHSQIIDGVLDALEEKALPLTTNIIPTSSEYKIGRDHIWKHMYRLMLSKRSTWMEGAADELDVA
ncbi:hypothetical protein NDN08_006938 [Rhodosorus marinus]|uniref:EngB-type G domain-containing protein n=1 Tax=Rhodosorus marinus TaxID=101924 RepID=A0AAV8UJ24_9RHOD|nr:hypothetical protein NDN08_006938 [Rhodosorus marinus]